jgi:branched-chain amino acid transport system ATP-binding protein
MMTAGASRTGVASPHAALLQVRNVSKRFGGVVANRDISLDVPVGRITGLIGPNGSGKTTLFNSIAGYHPIDSGSIRFDGREISRLRTAKIARLGVVRTFQQTHVYRKMNCVENMQISTAQAGESLRSMLRRPSAAITRQAESLLDFVGLQSKRFLPAGDLSFGQQKLLEFAMTLMNAPRLLLLDEPTAGINPVLINGLVDRLKRANAELGITLLVIEHNMRVIMNLASHIYCLAHGELLAQGAPDEVRNDPRVVEAYLGGR